MVPQERRNNDRHADLQVSTTCNTTRVHAISLHDFLTTGPTLLNDMLFTAKCVNEP